MEQTAKKAQLSEYLQTHEVALEEFTPIHESGYANQRFKRGDDWTDKEKKQHRDDLRHPYTVALLATKFNRHLAEQRGNRTQWKIRGRGEEDELQAELDTQAFKYVDAINKFKYVESEIYDNGLGIKYGVLHVDQDYSVNPLGDVKLTRWYFDQVVWDVNSKAYDLNEDCTFIDRFEWYTKDALYQMFPDQKEVIKFTPGEGDTTERKIKIVNYYKKDKGKQLIKVIWRQEPIYKKEFKVIPIDKSILSEMGLPTETQAFDTMKKAEAFVSETATKMLPAEMQAGLQARMDANAGNIMLGFQKNFRIVPVTTRRIKETAWTINNILEEKEIEWTNKYIVIPFFALNDDGYYFNLIDLVRDPQRAFDRLFSMIDKSTSKNIKGNNYQIVETQVRPEVLARLSWHTKKLAEGGHLFPVIEKDAISPLTNHNNITIEMTLVQMMQALIEDLMGGNAFQGLESNKKQTATEATLLEQGAKLGTFLFIDNLLRWKELAGEVIYDCILNTYDYEMKLNIAGDALGKKIQEALKAEGLYKMSDLLDTEGYLTRPAKRLSMNKMNVVIDQIDYSITARAEKNQAIMDYSAQLVQFGAAPVPPEITLKYSNLDATDKFGLQKHYEQQMAMLQEQQAKEEKFKEAEMIANGLPKLHEMSQPPEPKENGVKK